MLGMKKWPLVMITISLFVLVSIGCSKPMSKNYSMPSEMPDDFNFSLSYGVEGKEKVDTFKNIVVKDLVEDGIIEAPITLDNDEMKSIYAEMADMNIMGELDLGKPQNQCGSEPEDEY